MEFAPVGQVKRRWRLMANHQMMIHEAAILCWSVGRLYIIFGIHFHTCANAIPQWTSQFERKARLFTNLAGALSE